MVRPRGDDYVLEGEFDLALLGLFDSVFGGDIVTYLTMNCVNDEAMVHVAVSAVPAPAPAWLLAPGLLSIIGLGRKRIVV